MCTLGPVGNDLDTNALKWIATIEGPIGTPYEGGVFTVDIQIPRNYPYGPPRFTFVTKVFHPSVTTSGAIDLDMLHENWSPAITLTHVVCQIKLLLMYPHRS